MKESQLRQMIREELLNEVGKNTEFYTFGRITHDRSNEAEIVSIANSTKGKLRKKTKWRKSSVYGVTGDVEFIFPNNHAAGRFAKAASATGNYRHLFIQPVNPLAYSKNTGKSLTREEILKEAKVTSLTIGRKRIEVLNEMKELLKMSRELGKTDPIWLAFAGRLDKYIGIFRSNV